MSFTDTDLGTISNALRVAAMHFDENATAAKAYPRIAEQFTRQAIEARKLHEAIAEQTGIAS